MFSANQFFKELHLCINKGILHIGPYNNYKLYENRTSMKKLAYNLNIAIRNEGRRLSKSYAEINQDFLYVNRFIMTLADYLHDYSMRYMPQSITTKKVGMTLFV